MARLTRIYKSKKKKKVSTATMLIKKNMKQQDDEPLQTKNKAFQGRVRMVVKNIRESLNSLPHTSKVWLLNLTDNNLSLCFHEEINEHH